MGQPVRTFANFILWEPGNRRALLMALGCIIVQFVLFKLLYPYPDFFSDSYSYLFAALAHLDVNIWPIGYSKFLAVFHRINYSDTAFVGFQYFFLELAALYFYFTLLYFYQPSKATRSILFIFIVFNPLTLYLSNTINSDALFGALSILWFTQLIWIIQRPRVHQLFVQAILLFACFTIRNNAYYYPVVAAIAFLLIRRKWSFKLAGIVLPLLFIVPFIVYTKTKAYQLTGTRQFSLFTGWQLANNALYIYDQVEVDSAELPTKEARELNRITIAYFKKVNPAVYRDYLESYVGNFFIRQPEAPLKQYFTTHYQVKDEIQGTVAWAHASAAFEPFGKAIILHNPVVYMRFFVLPNVWHYFLPPLSHLEQFNYGINEVDPIAQYWFHYPSNKITCFSNGFQGILLMIYMACFLLFNGYFLWNLYGFIRKKGFKEQIHQMGATQWLILSFLVINFCFSVAATVNILRYQYVPMFVLLAFSLLISDYLEERAALEKKNKKFAPNSEKSSLYRSSKQIL